MIDDAKASVKEMAMGQTKKKRTNAEYGDVCSLVSRFSVDGQAGDCVHCWAIEMMTNLDDAASPTVTETVDALHAHVATYASVHCGCLALASVF